MTGWMDEDEAPLGWAWLIVIAAVLVIVLYALVAVFGR